MSADVYGAEVLVKAARAAAEAFIATLDAEASSPTASTSTDSITKYDPLHDNPPFTANPHGTESQRALAYITYLGAVGRLNAEEARGATSKEVSEFAKKAGYSDGKAVNGWNSRPGSPRSIENLDGHRFLSEVGRQWLEREATKLGLTLVGEIGATR